ncbi:acetyltransferase [Paenibacillus aestuarii]|uniref:Acetyltransferase n=1 Tax=Paenibacillus aestuarii TaxID=516965 RepID=A0ABW0KCN8_9BACL|nr:acetyltransferase [Paenibacillus aestuarii]
MEKIIIIGASGHAGVVIDIVEQENKYQIVALFDSSNNLGASAFGYPIIGREGDLSQCITSFGIKNGIIAIGDNWTRYKIMVGVLNCYPDFTFVRAIHPSAQIGKGVSLGHGAVVMPNCVINREAIIGNFSIVNTGATLDHQSVLGHFASLAPGVTTGGNVQIGDFSAIGIGACVKHNVSIGENTVIGAGSVVLEDCPSYVVSYGSPARIVRTRKAGDKYL